MFPNFSLTALSCACNICSLLFAIAFFVHTLRLRKQNADLIKTLSASTLSARTVSSEQGGRSSASSTGAPSTEGPQPCNTGRDAIPASSIVSISAAAAALLNGEAISRHDSGSSRPHSTPSPWPSAGLENADGKTGEVLFCAGATKGVSPFEAAMSGQLRRSSLGEGLGPTGLPDGLPFARAVSADVVLDRPPFAPAPLKHLRSLPERLRARTMAAALGNFELGPLIGAGSYGKVFKAKWRSTIIAVKVIKHDHTNASKVDALRESAVASCLQHPNILTTYKVLTNSRRTNSISSQPSMGLPPAPSPSEHFPRGISEPFPRGNSAGLPPLPPSPAGSSYQGGDLVTISHEDRCNHMDDSLETWLLQEFCDRGTLDKAIQHGGFRVEGAPHLHNLEAIYLTLKDIAAGMAFLHDIGVLHGDLKSNNVLLKATAQDLPRKFVAKLADFGLSQLLEPEAAHVSITNIGTIAYMPTELLQDGKLTYAVDIWSFGCIMWELWVGQRMHQDAKAQQVFCRVLMGRRSVIPDGMPPGYRELLDECWHEDPQCRPSFPEIFDRLRALYEAMMDATFPAHA